MAAEQELKPVYLLTGSDRPKIETALVRLRNRFAPEATEIVSAVDTPGDAAVALCNAGSLFGEARLVIVEDVDGRKRLRRSPQGRLEGRRRRSGRRLPEEPCPEHGPLPRRRGREEDVGARQGMRESGRDPRVRRRQEQAPRLGRRPVPAAGSTSRAGGGHRARPARRRRPARARHRGRQACDVGRRRAHRRARGLRARRAGERRADVRC